MRPIDFAMIGMLVALACFTTLAYRIGFRRGWDRAHAHRPRPCPSVFAKNDGGVSLHEMND